MQARKKQTGAVLVVGLIILIVMVLIGTTAISFSVLSEKMTDNQRNKQLALQAAESSLRESENWIRSQINPPNEVTSCSQNPCDVWAKGSFTNWLNHDQTWWETYARPFTTPLQEIATLPRYLIEAQSFQPYELDPDARSKGEGYYYYLMTSRGTGSTDEAKVVIQSVYTVQFK